MTTARPSPTAFFRLDAATGWRSSSLTGALVQASDALVLGQPGVLPIPLEEPFGSFGGATLPTGIAVSPAGEVLLADPVGNRLLIYTTAAGDAPRPDPAQDIWPFRTLWQPAQDTPSTPAEDELLDLDGDPPPRPAHADAYHLSSPTDVAFSPTGDLVVADRGNGRVIVYTWPELAARRIWAAPGGAPRSIAYDSRANLYVADAGRVWRLDSLWRLDAGWDGGGDVLRAPAHLAVADDDTVFTLDADLASVFRFDERGRAMPLTAPQAPAAGIANATSALFGYAFEPPIESRDGRLEHRQRARPDCPTLVLSGIAVDGQGRLQNTQLPLLALPRRIRLPRAGVFVSAPLDAGLPDFPWHRIVLDLQIPETARILVSTFTSAVELDDERVEGLDERDWSPPLGIDLRDPLEVPEVLVQSGPGRYMWLKIELFGDGLTTPALQAIEIQGPRRSAINMLPPVYKQDGVSADFLDRYLSYFDTLYAEIERQIADFTGYLDPAGVPEGAFLEWLGSWFDWQFLAAWGPEVRREMIAESITFFRERGTLAGLRRMLQWHTGLTDEQPQIIEHFRLRDRGGPPLFIGERALEPTLQELAHHFTIVLPDSVVPDADARLQVERIIDAQKPAHTVCALRVIHQGVRIGRQSAVGVDTWLGGSTLAPLGELTLGQAARLTRRGAHTGPAANQFEIGNTLLARARPGG